MEIRLFLRKINSLGIVIADLRKEYRDYNNLSEENGNCFSTGIVEGNQIR